MSKPLLSHDPSPRSPEPAITYLPQVSLRSGMVTGFEVLTRGETLRPWTEGLSHACREMQVLRDGASGPPPVMFLAVPDRVFADPGLPDLVAAALIDHGLEGSQLCLGISERTLMRSLSHAHLQLERLRGLGVGLALDHFGTGFSSLRELRRLPLDLFRLDHTFTEGLGENADDTAVVAAALATCRALGRVSMAPGVTDSGRAARLRSLGCDLAQGDYFSGPRSAGDLSHLLRRALPRLREHRRTM